MSYQGWTNYETWNVKLWLDNEQSSCYAMQELAATHRDQPAWILGDAIRDWLEDFMPDLGGSVWDDLLGSAWDNVNWEEIAEAYIEDLPDEEDDEED